MADTINAQSSRTIIREPKPYGADLYLIVDLDGERGQYGPVRMVQGLLDDARFDVEAYVADKWASWLRKRDQSARGFR